MCSTLCASAFLRRSCCCCCCPANTQRVTVYISFQHEKHPPMKPGLGTKHHSPEGICGKTTPRSPHVQPSPYLCRRCPRGAVFRTWAAALPCCGALSPAKKEEHIESPEMPQMLCCCLTALNQDYFPSEENMVGGSSRPQSSCVHYRGKLMRCQVLSSSRKEEGFVPYHALNCLFFFFLKVCMLTLPPWTRPVAPFSCLGPAEVGKEGVRKWQVLVGLSADMGLLAERHTVAWQGRPHWG